MDVYERKMREAFQKQTKLKLGRRMYSGDGDVYYLKNFPNRLVKIVYDSYCDVEKCLRVLRYLQRSNNPAVVKLYRVGSFKHEDGKGYYYVMDKLSLLPPGSRENCANDIRDTLDLTRQMVPAKIKSFVKHAQKLKYEHHDIHGYNIMRDKSGNIKFVDLESFMYQ